ncbi:hypothetical protein ACTFIU_000485 [Dictyostelium citrinum]
MAMKGSIMVIACLEVFIAGSIIIMTGSVMIITGSEVVMTLSVKKSRKKIHNIEFKIDKGIEVAEFGVGVGVGVEGGVGVGDGEVGAKISQKTTNWSKIVGSLEQSNFLFSKAFEQVLSFNKNS